MTSLVVNSCQPPDNSTWSPDNQLLVAGHPGGFRETQACNSIAEGSCAARFTIVSIDPETMTPTTLFESAGPPMGAATVALRSVPF